MLQRNLRKVKEEIKKKLPYLITLSYGLSIRYVYADGKSDPLASLKKLGTLVVSLVVVYGIVQQKQEEVWETMIVHRCLLDYGEWVEES